MVGETLTILSVVVAGMNLKFVVKSKDPDAESMLFERDPDELVSILTRSLPEDEMGEEEEDKKILEKELVGSTTPPPIPLREEGTPGDDHLTGKSKLDVSAVVWCSGPSS